jgi:hypothetical protein
MRNCRNERQPALAPGGLAAVPGPARNTRIIDNETETLAWEELILRELLNQAADGEPPAGLIAQNALRLGIRLRRRRPQRVAVSSAAAIAVIGVSARCLRPGRIALAQPSCVTGPPRRSPSSTRIPDS